MSALGFAARDGSIQWVTRFTSAEPGRFAGWRIVQTLSPVWISGATRAEAIARRYPRHAAMRRRRRAGKR